MQKIKLDTLVSLIVFQDFPVTQKGYRIFFTEVLALWS